MKQRGCACAHTIKALYLAGHPVAPYLVCVCVYVGEAGGAEGREVGGEKDEVAKWID